MLSLWTYTTSSFGIRTSPLDMMGHAPLMHLWRRLGFVLLLIILQELSLLLYLNYVYRLKLFLNAPCALTCCLVDEMRIWWLREEQKTNVQSLNHFCWPWRFSGLGGGTCPGGNVLRSSIHPLLFEHYLAVNYGLMPSIKPKYSRLHI